MICCFSHHWLITASQRSCGKVMFSQVSVILFEGSDAYAWSHAPSGWAMHAWSQVPCSTPHTGHHNTYGWKTNGMYPIGMLYYRPHSEASEGYVFTGVCHSVILVLYSGKQTDATALVSSQYVTG